MRKLSLRQPVLVSIALVGSALMASAVALGAEVSVLSGVYKDTSAEADKTDLGGERTIGAGARYSDQMDSRAFWFGQGQLTLSSYDKGDLEEKPSDSTSLSLGGGVRYYFNKLSESVSPFAYGLGLYKAEKSADFSGGGYTETESNGLFYGAAFGIRFSLDKDFFVDFEVPLFESALFATTTVETYDAATDKTSKLEKKRTELWVDSSGSLVGLDDDGSLHSLRVALGMRI